MTLVDSRLSAVIIWSVDSAARISNLDTSWLARQNGSRWLASSSVFRSPLYGQNQATSARAGSVTHPCCYLTKPRFVSSLTHSTVSLLGPRRHVPGQVPPRGTVGRLAQRSIDRRGLGHRRGQQRAFPRALYRDGVRGEVMEYVDGRTLRDLLRDDRRLLPERALEITDGVLRALDYSHRHGIVHRDIKPGNVMLTRTGEVKVMDFGIARAVSDAQATMTQTAQVIGTAQYLSPEQARGERVDARSDLYSTGCLLYELLTGRPPFLGDSPVAIAYQHVRENPVPPSQLDPDIPA